LKLRAWPIVTSIAVQNRGFVAVDAQSGSFLYPASMTHSLAIVGTAGHIDHGKTALVGRLTGVDTDRLKEEKERGISIDLGFAPLTTPAGRRVGIVDVPGHERFVRNMLAGVGGIDVVLLVIAADEGVMPQTREHFAIVKLLGIPKGIVALTKADLVDDPAWFDEVERDVRELVKGSALEAAPIVRVSSTKGTGTDALLRELDRLLESGADRPVDQPVRLPIDRVFTIEGFGTVVTGTLWRGRIAVGDTVAVEPRGETARVRSVEVHGAQVEAAVAGQRTAVALHGLAKTDLARGDWLVAPKSLAPSSLLTARVDLLPDVPKPLQQRTRVRFHLGSGEALARVVLLETEELAPGESALAQLRLETPVVPARGDRFVLRSYSPMRTIGGGTVLEPQAELRKRGGVEGLEVAEAGDLVDRARQALRDAGTVPARPEDLARKLEVDPGGLGTALVGLLAEDEARALADGRMVSRDGWDAARERVLDEFAAYAKGFPLRFGPTRGELKARATRALDGALFDAALAELTAEGVVVARGDRISPAPGRELVGKHAQAAAKLRAALDAGAYAPPPIAELSGQLGLPPNEATELLGRLVADGEIVRLDPDLAWGRTAWDTTLAKVREHFATKPELAVGDLKEALGISRKFAVPLLETLDREGLTVRDGNVRRPGPRLNERR
jgi:selenocysteine-specific elongation factor